jgi:mannose-6-phosphate isomerase-like protein (cupin superfamily)
MSALISFLTVHDLRSARPPVEMTMSPRAFERAAVAMAHAMREMWREQDLPVLHEFTGTTYFRTITMPAQTLVVGNKHRTRHMNIVLSGSATVLMNGERVDVKAGDTIISEVGVRKVLLIHEECRWMTVHENPSNERDISALENHIVDKASATIRDERLIQEFRASLPLLQI